MTLSPSTPTGIPIRLCMQCGFEHPITRQHCDRCGRASLFIGSDGVCVHCRRREP